MWISDHRFLFKYLMHRCIELVTAMALGWSRLGQAPDRAPLFAPVAEPYKITMPCKFRPKISEQAASDSTFKNQHHLVLPLTSYKIGPLYLNLYCLCVLRFALLHRSLVLIVYHTNITCTCIRRESKDLEKAVPWCTGPGAPLCCMLRKLIQLTTCQYEYHNKPLVSYLQ